MAEQDEHRTEAAAPLEHLRVIAVEQFVTAMDLGHLVADVRFADVAARAAHRTELVVVLSERFAQRTTDEWMNRLPDSVPAAPVRSMADALDREELSRRSMLVEYDHPTLGRVRSVGPPVLMTGHEPSHRPGSSLVS